MPTRRCSSAAFDELLQIFQAALVIGADHAVEHEAEIAFGRIAAQFDIESPHDVGAVSGR